MSLVAIKTHKKIMWPLNLYVYHGLISDEPILEREYTIGFFAKMKYPLTPYRGIKDYDQHRGYNPMGINR